MTHNGQQKPYIAAVIDGRPVDKWTHEEACHWQDVLYDIREVRKHLRWLEANDTNYSIMFHHLLKEGVAQSELTETLLLEIVRQSNELKLVVLGLIHDFPRKN